MNEAVIVLIEDNPDDVELTRLALEETRVANRLIVLRDGQEAIDWFLHPEKTEHARLPSEIPTLVLLDLNLPKINGLEVLQRLKSEPSTRNLPVVILTSSIEERDIFKSYNLGANSFIQKPVDYEQFVYAVKQLGIYWMLLNEPSPRSM